MPTVELELDIHCDLDIDHIAGIDEAGRGAIAGPVVAAAVILPITDQGRLESLSGVDDSKKLTPLQRESMFEKIIEAAISYGVGIIDAFGIDEMGIIPANAAAMKQAISQLDPPPDYLLIDGRMRLKSIATRQQALIRGDGISLSIASASILAKVTRDRMMLEYDNIYPSYGLCRHKGYCTREHVQALERLGPSAIHRHSFSPIRQPIFQA